MNKLEELKNSILADGIIDRYEVEEIRKVIFEDGKIDKEEAEFLFELNDAVSGKNNHETWEVLFVESITSFLLDDDASPGEIDEEEARWLLSKIESDGILDEVEKALIKNLKDKAKKFPSILNF